MALDPTAIVPVNDPNCLNSANAASKVYPPLAGTTTSANDVGAAEQILRNQTHTLNEIKVDVAGDTMTGPLTIQADLQIDSGNTFIADGVTVSGAVTFAASGRVALAGRKQLWRARVALSDADHTVDVDDGDRFDLPTGAGEPAAPRTITLAHTGVVPEIGETLTFFWYPKTNPVGGGTQFTIRRSGGTTIATFDGSAVIDTGLVWAEFEYTSAGWRLGKCSGTLHDGTDYYGVIGGAGS